MELSENSELLSSNHHESGKMNRLFYETWDWPEFNLIRPTGANRLIFDSKTIRTIAAME